MVVSSPFGSPGSIQFLYHATHHKCGTHWFKRILSQIGNQYQLRWQEAVSGDSLPTSGVLFDQNSHLNPTDWARFRGSHMIRDPRDVVVSGYFYHLWTAEAWAHEPKAELGGQTYQQHLKSLPIEAGLIAEIDKCKFVFNKMRNWNYRNPAIRELKYEAVFTDPDTQFRRLFKHYGFHDTAIEAALDFARRSDFRAVSGRAPGIIREQTVMRAGIPGQWTEYFTPRVRQHFRDTNPDLLQKLGYETTESW